MPDNDFDRASVGSTSNSSITSTLSTIWPIIPSSSQKINLSLDDLCSHLRATTDMEQSPIEELSIRKEMDGVQHEFLLILLCKPSGGEFWMRLERARPVSDLGKLVSGFLEANGIVGAIIDN